MKDDYTDLIVTTLDFISLLVSPFISRYLEFQLLKNPRSSILASDTVNSRSCSQRQRSCLSLRVVKGHQNVTVKRRCSQVLSSSRIASRFSPSAAEPARHIFHGVWATSGSWKSSQGREVSGEEQRSSFQNGRVSLCHAPMKTL